MSNILIIESENDKFFFKALISHMNLKIEVNKPVCNIDEYKCLKGMGNLNNALESLKSRILKHNDIDKIAIIFDTDDVGIEKRKKDIQKIIDKVFNEDNILRKKFSIFILNANGHGELETILRKIKSKDSSFANCLVTCHENINKKQENRSEDKKLSDKDLNKSWVHIYHKYDHCDKNEREKSSNFNYEASFKKGIYDFNLKTLDKLKEFLKNLANK